MERFLLILHQNLLIHFLSWFNHSTVFLRQAFQYKVFLKKGIKKIAIKLLHQLMRLQNIVLILSKKRIKAALGGLFQCDDLNKKKVIIEIPF